MKTYGKAKLTVEQMHSNPSDAKSAGHIHYFTGKPCKHGHLSPRFTNRSNCIECNRIANLRYYKPHPRKLLTPEEKAERKKAQYQANKEYALKHKEHIRGLKQKWWEKNKKELSFKNAEWKKNHPENERKRSRKRYKADPEKFIENAKKYYHENRETILEKRRKYRAANREKIREQNRAYYLKKKKKESE